MQIRKAKFIVLAYLLIGLAGSVFAINALLRIPADPKNSVLFGYSPTRLAILSVLVFIALLFASLLGLELGNRRFREWWSRATWSAARVNQAFIISVVIFFVGLFLLLLPPPQLLHQMGSYYQRILPLIFLVTQLALQTVLLIVLLVPEQLPRLRGQMTGLGNWLLSQQAIGYLLVGLSLVISLSQVYYSQYNKIDEGDIFSTGLLISKGWLLYKDIFSHHFPLPYFGVGLIVKIFGNSFFAVRFAHLVLRVIIFAITIKISRFSIPIGLTAISWSLVGHFFLGNTLLYQSFSAPFLISGFLICFSIIQGRIPWNKTAVFIAGLFLSCAVLSDPYLIFPTVILLLGVVAASFFLKSAPLRSRVRTSLISGGMFSLGLGSVCLVFFLYLVATRTAVDFFQNAILFNTQIYSKYDHPLNFMNFFIQLLRGLDIFTPPLRLFWDPYHFLMGFGRADEWAYFPIFARLAVILSALVLFFRGKLLNGILVYCFGGALLVRASAYWMVSPFILYGLSLAALQLAGSLRTAPGVPAAAMNKQPTRPILPGLGQLAFAASSLLLGFMFFWINIRGAETLIANRDQLTFASNFAGVFGDASYFKKATCYQTDASILVYPLDPFVYFFSGIPPASKYQFMLPWVAEVGQEEVLTDLQRGKILVNIQPYSDISYMDSILSYLDSQYLQKNGEFFFSPDLARECPPEKQGSAPMIDSIPEAITSR